MSDGEVFRATVEKRYLVNLVTREVQGNCQETIQRWKVVMNRSRILDIEAVE